MAFRVSNLSRFPTRGNVMGPERWASILAGLGLTLLAARTHGGFRRAAASTLGLSLLSRGAAGYCGMKAAIHGDATMGQGMREQYQRVRALMGKGPGSIDSLETLYIAELQELYSAESQLGDLLLQLSDAVEHPGLRHHFHGYATELHSRAEDLGRILGSYGCNPREHPDQAMHSLINETRKMAHVCGATVRDAALVASVQRIIHYKIAGFGTVAAYAKTMGHIDEASRFAEYAERDEAIDAELSDLAKSTLNPQASMHPRGPTTGEARTH
jgi:ferritin-like metal-binding protein YciE